MKREMWKAGDRMIEVLTPETDEDLREIERRVAQGTFEVGGFSQPTPPKKKNREKKR